MKNFVATFKYRNRPGPPIKLYFRNEDMETAISGLSTVLDSFPKDPVSISVQEIKHVQVKEKR